MNLSQSFKLCYCLCALLSFQSLFLHLVFLDHHFMFFFNQLNFKVLYQLLHLLFFYCLLLLLSAPCIFILAQQFLYFFLHFSLILLWYRIVPFNWRPIFDLLVLLLLDLSLNIMLTDTFHNSLHFFSLFYRDIVCLFLISLKFFLFFIRFDSLLSFSVLCNFLLSQNLFNKFLFGLLLLKPSLLLGLLDFLFLPFQNELGFSPFLKLLFGKILFYLFLFFDIILSSGLILCNLVLFFSFKLLSNHLVLQL